MHYVGPEDSQNCSLGSECLDLLHWSLLTALQASGKLGRPLLAALLDQPQFQVTVVARESSQASYDTRAFIVKISDDFKQDELVATFKGHDSVILAMAHAGNAHHRKLIDAAVEANVKHLIPNHWSSNAEQPQLRELSERQGALEEDIEYLRTKEGTGLTWTAIVTGIFFDL